MQMMRRASLILPGDQFNFSSIIDPKNESNIMLHSHLLALFLVCAIPAPIALGQQPSPQDIERATKLFDEGETYYRVQDYAKALDAYKEAYIISKTPELLFNIGQCQRLLNRYEDAIKSYKTYLADASQISNRAQVESFIAELEFMVKNGITKADIERATKLFDEGEAHYRVQDYTKALSAYREAYLLSKEPDLLFNIGQCQRQLNRYEDAIKSYNSFLADVPENPNRSQVEAFIKELEVKLAASPTTSTTEPPSKKPPYKLLYAGAAASGAIGLVLGGISLSSGRAAGKQAEIQDGETADLAEIERLLSRSRRLGLAADSLIAVALISGGAGFFLGRSQKEPTTSLSVSLSGVALSVSF
jgi:tetratricopeptide (TPR) repeat protein